MDADEYEDAVELLQAQVERRGVLLRRCLDVVAHAWNVLRYIELLDLEESIKLELGRDEEVH